MATSNLFSVFRVVGGEVFLVLFCGVFLVVIVVVWFGFFKKRNIIRTGSTECLDIGSRRDCTPVQLHTGLATPV